ncbi:MAG: CRISPR-associated endonuclease Cas3'' [Caldisericaceae bacterium]
MEFYSHIEKVGSVVVSKTLLKDHLREVGEKSSDYFFFTDQRILSNISYFVGLCHDFGKYTTFFQERLLGESKNSSLGDHSFISAIFTAWVFSKKLDEFKELEESILRFLPLITFFVVYHHHSDLTSLEDIDNKLQDNISLENVKKQIQNLKENETAINVELKEIGLNLTIEEFESALQNKSASQNIIYELSKEIYFYNRDDGNKVKISLLILSLFSSLIDADKKCAGKVKDVDRRFIPDDIVDIYKKKVFSISPISDLNLMREEIYQNVVSKVEGLDLSKRIYTLTSPTGSGKTLTSFSFAIKLRNRIAKEFGYTPRIIYSLPFISIIQQNFKILQNVLSNIEDFKENASNYIIEHHHLSKISYEEGNEFKEVEEALLLLESWESEVIVTTFIQFLYTIIGFKNRFLKKFHNIARSIIILDEVQNIPIEYWDLVENVLKNLANFLNCYIILMTATRTLIFEEKDATELLDNHSKYFKKFKRVTLMPALNINSIETLKEYFIDLYRNSPYSSYLIVLNTIGSSIEIFELLKSSIQNGIIYYLSTNITPLDRLKRITEIKIFLKYKEAFKRKIGKETLQKELKDSFEKEILENNYERFLEMAEKDTSLIVISTQVIEAGVDLDFDTVIRDIGPFDSIVQVAGRCNREFRNEIGVVKIVYLKEDGNSFAGMVYRKISPDISFKILRDKSQIEEEEFCNLIDEYFKESKRRRSSQESEDIYNAILDLCFFDPFRRDTVANFKLIKEEKVFPIFVEVDKQAKEIWNKYLSIVNNENFSRWEKKNALLKIKQDFEKYLISVRVDKDDFSLFEIAQDNDLGYVPFEKLEKYYNIETGFKRKQHRGETIII